MGEVYRADDLTLGQPVALKFLPEATASDQSSLERFHNEVRIARRISHPNVCRIYDIGEADGLAFLSMEYVDGEDLGSLLRRIGRLPHDKALEIARKLCAGVAAAHDKGVLHRDLKPANIMLNGEGEVVIMDFGLAEVAELIPQDQIRFGTPAYMAPEQLAGKEVTSKSDIYSLGLVLYEIFTGKRAFQADTLAEIVRVRSQAPTPASPAGLVRDLDPGVERVILRCLESEPAMRPASIRAVAAALPGGDPLAAALAAGETPSPQMVAAAGEVEGLAPRIAVPLLATLILGLAVCYWLGARESIYDHMTLDQPPEVLAHRAGEIIARVGYTAPVADTAYGFYDDGGFSRYVQKNDKPRPDWDKILKTRPAIGHFWYRTSPQEMIASDYTDSLLTPGIVTTTDPPFTNSGMVRVVLDPEGQLYSFEAIPPQQEEKANGAKPVDWSPLFAAADIDPAQLKPAEPIWNSLANSDVRAAWTGTWPGGSRPLRVEAAALRGKPVFFSLMGPWTTPTRQVQEQTTAGEKASGIILIVIVYVAMFGAVFFAIRNYRKKRGDPKGAFRLGLFIFAVQMALWIFRAHFAATLSMFFLMVMALSTSLFFGVLVALLYLALEPYVRRRWPHSIISWSRLLLGRSRDPLVGRDVLFGLVLGTGWVLIFLIFIGYLLRTGSDPQTGSAEYLLGARHAIGAWLTRVPTDCVQATLVFFFIIFLFRVLLRNHWLAAGAFVLLFATMQSLRQEHFWIPFLTYALVYSLAAVALVRFGLVSLSAALLVTDLVLGVPMTANPSHWFIGSTIFVFASVAALGIWAFYAALGEQKLWKEELFE